MKLNALYYVPHSVDIDVAVLRPDDVTCTLLKEIWIFSLQLFICFLYKALQSNLSAFKGGGNAMSATRLSA